MMKYTVNDMKKYIDVCFRTVNKRTGLYNKHINTFKWTKADLENFIVANNAWQAFINFMSLSKEDVELYDKWYREDDLLGTY